MRGFPLSELIRTKTLEALEDEYDARVGELAYQEYLDDVAKGYQPLTIEEMAEELGIDGVASSIVRYIYKNVDGSANPREKGKGLTANRAGQWLTA